MPIFFTKKSCNRGGWNHPPQMPLTVNTLRDVNWISRSGIFGRTLPKIAFFGEKSGKFGKIL